MNYSILGGSGTHASLICVWKCLQRCNTWSLSPGQVAFKHLELFLEDYTNDLSAETRSSHANLATHQMLTDKWNKLLSMASTVSWLQHYRIISLYQSLEHSKIYETIVRCTKTLRRRYPIIMCHHRWGYNLSKLWWIVQQLKIPTNPDAW